MALKGVAKLKKDIRENNPSNLYIICGEENYLKNYYLEQLERIVVDENFKEFNLHIFEGNKLTLNELNDAIESYPAMSDKKMIIVKDFNLLKPEGEFKKELYNILEDLPEYICLVFYYDILEFNADKRLKIYSLIDKKGIIAEFINIEGKELINWIQRRIRAEKKEINDETAEYMVFICGSSMVNLITEINKVVAHSVTSQVTKVNIDAVCSKTLDAVIFDLTDAIGNKRFDKALMISRELQSQKNDPIMLTSSIAKHIQKMYGIKLLLGRGERDVMNFLGTRSSFYTKKMISASTNFNLNWLRNTVKKCAEIDQALKSTGINKEKTLELFILSMVEDDDKQNA